MIFSYLMMAFIILPLVELWLLVQLGSRLGWGAALLLVVGTGIIGAWLARVQGMQVMLEIQRDLAEGRVPTPRLMDGVMILVAGVLLVAPGLITDATGFLLLLPPVRVFIRGWLRMKLEKKMREGGTIQFSFRGR